MGTVEQALCLSLIIQAISSLFWEGMIFGKVGGWLEHNSHTLWKPLMGCTICMTPWYGAVAWWFFGLELLAIPVAMGLNVVISLWTKD